MLLTSSSTASTQRTLILGDGNFSFSASYHRRFPSVEVVATSFDSEAEIRRKYREFERIHKSLTQRGTASIYHNVNAVDIRATLQRQQCVHAKFDRIFFNFPHLGVEDMYRHQSLIGHWFASAKEVFNNNVDDDDDSSTLVIITLQQHQYDRWKVEYVAALNGLRLIRKIAFIEREWPMYEARRHQVDKTFRLDGDNWMYVFSMSGNDTVAAAVDEVVAAPSAGAAKAPNESQRKKRARIEMKTKQYNADGSVIKHVCPECGKEFVLLYSMQAHMTAKHATTMTSSEQQQQQQQYACNDCDDKVFYNAEALNHHRLAMHERSNDDDECKERGVHGVWSEYVSTSSTDSGELKCAQCGLVFVSADLLRTHVGELSPPPPLTEYQCSHCDRSFRELRARAQHINHAHTTPDTGDRSENTCSS